MEDDKCVSRLYVGGWSSSGAEAAAAAAALEKLPAFDRVL